ncbi:NACHT and WD repeat domain-containing 2 [Mycena chlorophos]|uniref:NACHT and WD repeat domain-containing 2 n=1 Tax=Mycena chlorophos TaxID=658473 RepID=A0A8H6T0H4_MYCCL|nr:NACHT and WD repeat domain-containing 2 [Mycena chlorophos]
MSDEITYLGSRAPSGRYPPPQPRPVTGVVLHVEAGSEPAHSIVLRKSDAAVVQIGRRPGTRSGGRLEGNRPGVASFNCPVVSRSHAKLVFADSGAVYCCDAASHHGSWIRPRNGDAERKLVPETPIQLSDGDLLTFGKQVTSSDGLGIVKPVVCRVAFLYGANPPPFKPLVVPNPGRYGVSSDSESDSSHDSDIEELPPPWHSKDSGNGKFVDPFIPKIWVPEDFQDEDEIEDDDQPDQDHHFDDHYSEDSQYGSSMDLSSSPEPVNQPSEPVVIGAWPRSPSSSPSIFSSSFPPIRLVSSSTPLIDEPESPKAVVEDALDDEIIVVDKQPEPESDAAQLKDTLSSLKSEVDKLQVHRRKYKQRFNSNIASITDKFTELEEKTTEMNDLYNLLSDKVNENADSCQQAQAQLDVIQLDLFQQRMDPADKDEQSQDDSKATAKMLEGLVAEMTELRDTTRKEMAEELQSVRDAKDALKILTEEVLVQTQSLKRKRVLDDTDEGSNTVAERPRKRVRQVARVLAQTTAMGVVGAAVCWSALAFA